MITSKKQLIAAKEKVSLLKESLLKSTKKFSKITEKSEKLTGGSIAGRAGGKAKSVEIPERLMEATRSQISELIEEIEAEIREYQAIEMISQDEYKINSLDDLMAAPIRYRLYHKMTLEEFAYKVGVHSRQIARYEADRYHNINMNTLLKIMEKLGFQIDGLIRLKSTA